MLVRLRPVLGSRLLVLPVFLGLRLCLVLWVPGLVCVWAGLAGLGLVVLCRGLLLPCLVLWVWLVVRPCVFRVRVRCLVMAGVVWCCGGGVRRLVLTWRKRACCWGLRLCLVPRLVVFLPLPCSRPCLVPRPLVLLCLCLRRLWRMVVGVLVWGLVRVCVIGVRVLVLVAGWCLVVVWLLVGGRGLWGVCVLWRVA